MMTFLDKEKSLTQSEPYELHEFWRGDVASISSYTKFLVGIYGTHQMAKGKTDSTLDTSWGDSGYWDEPDGYSIFDVHSLSDGRNLVAVNNYKVTMLKADGTIDTSFATNGTYTVQNNINIHKILRDKSGNFHLFGGVASISSDKTYEKISSDGTYIGGLTGAVTSIRNFYDAQWSDSNMTRILAVGNSAYPISGNYPQIIAINPYTYSIDTTWTGNIGVEGYAEYDYPDPFYYIRVLSDGGFVIMKTSTTNTLTKILSDGSAIDTSWGTSGRVSLGAIGYDPEAQKMDNDSDDIYTVTYDNIGGTDYNIISHVDSTGSVVKSENIEGSAGMYNCLYVFNSKLFLGTNSSGEANYNVEQWSNSIVYESGFDLDGATNISLIFPDESTLVLTPSNDIVEAWRYADAPGDIVYDGNKYTACYITGNKIEAGTTAVKCRTIVKTNWNNSFTWQYTTQIPGNVIHYNRYRGQGEDVKLIYTGDVLQVGFKQTSRQGGRYAEITIEPPRASLGEMGLVPRYSRQCTVDLYSLQCGVNLNLYETTGTLDSYSANVLTSTTFGGQADGYWKGGQIIIGDYRAKVVDHSANDITILPYLYEINAGDSFTIYPGCDHLSTTCDTKFSNLNNFKGQPNIPLKNIFEEEAMFR